MMSAKVQYAYDKDFYAWTIHNAELMRQGKFSEIDKEHIAEELESMGKNNKREFINRFALLIAHLLKWKFQPIRRGRSWMLAIKKQRFELLDLLEESPSLQHEIEAKFKNVYEKAIRTAVEETGFEESGFPQNCPFTLT